MSSDDVRRPIAEGSPHVAHQAKLLAEQQILMAKSETLQKLGEDREAESLAKTLARKYVG